MDGLQAKPSRAELADAALKAATELGLMLKDQTPADLARVAQFRDVLHQTTEGWLDNKIGKLTDAQTARLYLDAYEQAHGSAAKSIDEFLINIRGVLQDFDNLEQKKQDQDVLKEMLKFTLALHTLLIGEAYGRLSHWNHKELLSR